VQLFFLPYLKESCANFGLPVSNISRISCYPVIRPYRISGRAIWYPARYRIYKRPEFPAGYPAGRISGAFLIIISTLKHLLNVKHKKNKINVYRVTSSSIKSLIGMHWKLIWLDIWPAGYPAYLIFIRISGKASFRISGRILPRKI
jgi:hypothetical protein